MKRKKSLIALLLIMATLFLTACGNSGSEGEQKDTDSSEAETTITVAQTSEVANLNPTLQPRTPDSNVQRLIFDHLVIPDEELNYVGDLAKSWDISDDGLVYTFYLHEGVTWHDGEKFDAEDVVFTFTSLADPSYIGGTESRVMGVKGAQEYQNGEADSVEGIYAKDEYTVVFELIEPNAAFLSNLYNCVLPEHILGAVSPGDWEKDDFNRAPIGTGKYKFVDWKSGEYIELELNEDYLGNKPSIDRVYYRFGDETTLTAALINGEIDVLYNLSASEIDTLEASSGVSCQNYETMSVYYIGLNQQNEYLSDLRVRQALSHGLDKDKIISTVYGDSASATDDIFPENHWSHSDNVTVYEYDVDKAKTLLEEVGFVMNESTGYYEMDGKNLHFTFDLVTATDVNSVAQLIQQYWAKIGVELEIIEQDFSTLAFSKLFPTDDAGNPRYVTADDFDMYTLGFGVEVDPDEYRDYLTTVSDAGSWNFISYSNESVDELLQKQLILTDVDERAACFQEISEIVSEDIPWIPLYIRDGIAGVSDRVGNFTADFRGITFQIEKWTVSE